jgi:DNA primase
MQKLSVAQAKEIDLVDLLAAIGHQPQKVRNHDHWYLSPFREEKTASFKVNRKLNVWFDFGEGKGGNLIDFGIQYFRCSVGELLDKLAQLPDQNFSFHPQKMAGEKKAPDDGKILILDERRLVAQPLLQYLQKRCIPVEIAEPFCREIDFLLYGKKHTAIGFQNDAGGYELRNLNFKGSSSPKQATFINNKQDQIAVFEGFFSFLSLQTINRQQTHSLTNFLILNSLSFFQQERQKMEEHQHVHLFLDRDTAGRKFTEEALQWDKTKYIDRSPFYQNRKDLNDWLVHHEYSLNVSRRMGRHF